MDDSDNDITLQARRFGNRLNGRYHLPVHLVDERLTSRAALSGMREAGYTAARSREEIDSHAACEILLDFLNDPGQKQTS
jgi:putative Holliday junction resolvase